MGWVSLSIPLLFFGASLRLLPVSTAEDTLTPGKALSVNQTLVSASGAFALGFFSPGGDAAAGADRYLGIWYNNLPNRTVVWVANRETPTGSAAVLTMTGDRNIALLDSNGSVVWSSGVATVPNGTVAMLLDSGNLVLRGEDGSELWQSFDHPTDTILPEMKLSSNFRTGAVQRIVAWKDAQDPSPGSFSFGVDPRTSLQVVTWRDSEPYWRSHVWNGKSLSGVRETNATPSQYVLKVTRDAQEISITFSATEGTAPARYVLEPTGTLKVLIWVEAKKDWIVPWSRPSQFCDPYDRCGPSGTCDSSGNTPTCTCLRGFVPRNQAEWDRGNFSGGCLRRVQLRCDRGDQFLRAEGVKLPDRLTLIANTSEAQCQTECLYSCHCTAYAYANVSEGPDRSRCLVWVGDLTDLEKVRNGGDDLFVRLVASELANASEKPEKQKPSLRLIIIFVTGALFLVILFYVMWRYKNKTKDFWKRRKGQVLHGFSSLRLSNGDGRGESIDLLLLSFDSIATAMNNFSDSNKLGEGGFGKVYKGILSTGQKIAIKRLSKGSSQGEEEFKNEVALIAKLQHKNLVRLLGFCIQGEERILVYEYLPNNSLDALLFDPTKQVQLDWARRFNIIKGVARGLMYLHLDSRFKIVHRDLKASNILLDEDMNPQISDFGMARIFVDNENQARTKRVVGTYGYMSPEYAMKGLFSMKSDVYSYGVLLLEIISGQRNSNFHGNEVFLNLLTYAWQLWQEDKVTEFLDSSITQTSCLAEVLRSVHIGLLCVQDDVNERPSMSSIVFMLENHTTIQAIPRRPIFMSERSLNANELPRRSPGSLTVNDLTISIIEGR